MSGVVDWVKSFFRKTEEEAEDVLAKRRADLRARQKALAEDSKEISEAAQGVATMTTQHLSDEERAQLQAMLEGRNLE